MSKTQTIKVELTSEQIKQLAPLFQIVRENPNTGFILAQIGEGYMIAGFTTPIAVKNGMEKTIEKYGINPFSGRFE